jgi:phosphomevalonate kinase
VQVEAGDTDHHSVVASGLRESRLAFRGGAEGAIEWLRPAAAPADGALLEHVWRCLRPVAAGGYCLTLDTRDFSDPARGAKFGFGSSAALTVALVAALGQPDAPLPELYRTAVAAHRNFQAGRGSGVDIAAAVFGGVIGFTPDAPAPRGLPWPAGLEFGFYWSGRAASTADKLAQVERMRRERGLQASRGRLVAAAAAVYDTWQTAAAGDSVLDPLRAYAPQLRQFSVDHNLGVFDAGHQTLFDEALKRGLVYKPCGAGGGDVGVVFALQPSAVLEFTECARHYGFEWMDVLPDPRGVRYEAWDPL